MLKLLLFSIHTKRTSNNKAIADKNKESTQHLAHRQSTFEFAFSNNNETHAQGIIRCDRLLRAQEVAPVHVRAAPADRRGGGGPPQEQAQEDASPRGALHMPTTCVCQHVNV